jgi:polo-like kinase 1
MEQASNSNPSAVIYKTIEEKAIKMSGDFVIRRYQKGKFLGKGGFANVYEFTNTATGEVFAGKVINKASLSKHRTKQKLMSEIKIHKRLNHENIVKLERFFEDSENVYILLELCENQSLSHLLKRRRILTEVEVKCYLA